MHHTSVPFIAAMGHVKSGISAGIGGLPLPLGYTKTYSWKYLKA
jgi:hypothetical protein